MVNVVELVKQLVLDMKELAEENEKLKERVEELDARLDKLEIELKRAELGMNKNCDCEEMMKLLREIHEALLGENVLNDVKEFHT